MVAVKVGSPVRGEDFFDREREQRRLWQHLDTDHVLLLAPRRVGKTSLLRDYWLHRFGTKSPDAQGTRKGS